MSYKSRLSANNAALRNILNTINELPSNGGGAGKKMYSFGVLSDIHLRWGSGEGSANYNYRNGITDFHRAIPALQNLGADFVCISGDVGYDSAVAELQLYKTALETYATVPFYACSGNHDYSHTDAIWREYVGHPLNHEFVIDGDVYLFMSLVQSSSSADQAAPYSTSLTWLKERLARYKGSRIFVFMHYPITGYAGLRDDTYYGFSSASTEDNELLAALINTRNVIVFSGHTHYKFGAESDYFNINVFSFPGKEVSLVHVPSSAYPRNSSHTEEADLSEGYMVDVYENSVVLRGVDLVSGEYMSEYVYELTNSNNPASSSGNAILVSGTDVSLKSNESAEIEVSLAEPADITVAVEESNEYITLSANALVFTTENYNVPQKIVITAGNIEGSGLATIALRAEGLTERTVSVTLVYEAQENVVAISGSQAPVNGTVYGGECGSYTAHQQLTTANAGEYNFTLHNLNLKSASTAIYMSSADSATTVNIEGVNTLDTSGTGTGGQRAISSSGTSGNNLIGNGSGAELILKNPANSTAAVIKGQWTLDNVAVSATGAVDPTSGGISVVGSGISIVNSGSFSLNGACVRLLQCENGVLMVNLGSATPGVSSLLIEEQANDGYVLEHILVDGVPQSIKSAITMPAENETVTIQGVFTA